MSDTLQEEEDQMSSRRKQLEYEASEVFDYGTRQRARKQLAALDAKEDQKVWLNCCQGYTHMPWCAEYKEQAKESRCELHGGIIGCPCANAKQWSPLDTDAHEPATRGGGGGESEISNLLDRLQSDWAAMIKERDELRAERIRLREVVQELLNRFYPHLCNRGPNCDKCRALLRGAAILRDQKEPSE